MGYTRRTNHLQPNTTQNEVFDILWGLKKDGYSEPTITFVRKALQVLEEGCELVDPNRVKALIANLETAESYKRNLCYAYEHYFKKHGLTWTRPRYYIREKLPKIPSMRASRCTLRGLTNI